MIDTLTIEEALKRKFPGMDLEFQETKDEFSTLWVPRHDINKILNYLKNSLDKPYNMLYDLTAIDERTRQNKNGQPESDFTVVYQLFSFERNNYLRIKSALKDNDLNIKTITNIWPSANWYEREVFDMFNIRFEGHPLLKRILMPLNWEGHPLRKDHPARATEMEPFKITSDEWEQEKDTYKFVPEDWGLKKTSEETDYMFLNLGPQHPGTHGVLRLMLQLEGEEIFDMVPEIGFHHRGAEKMGERQSWHTYIPYTDRVDYLSGVLNNMAYLLAVEKLGDIKVPPRAQVIRIMLNELFRISNHLVWFGTFTQDLGQLSPVFFMFNDRERLFKIIESICGFRMHPGWFRIGGVAADLPKGWDNVVKSFLEYMPKRLKEYEKLILKNRIFKVRTKGIGIFNTEEAIDWGVTGPNLRATGLEWDFRKKMPYGGYDQFEFDVPIAFNGDCYDRLVVRIEEMRQSLRIIGQCLNNMPEGPYKSDHPLTTPPLKDYTMHDIETLIHHFLNVTWGPVMPAGEAFFGIEGAKGNNGYYLISDGSTSSYRTRIRTPSFPHMQMMPFISRGYNIADLISILGSIDFVLGDIDR